MSLATRYILGRLAAATLAITAGLGAAVWLTQSLRLVDLIVNRGLPIAQFLKLARHRLLALPLLLAATALIAAAFSLRGPRRGGVAMIIGAGVFMGFLLYSLSDIAFALALSAKIPAPLAAWAPAVASMLLGIALLLHLEDG